MTCWLCCTCEVAWYAASDCCWLCGGNHTIAVPAAYPQDVNLYYLTDEAKAGHPVSIEVDW